MCLICGHVGCGRYREGHAAEHSKESGHAYALELEAQRVWDYSSDNYVHRLCSPRRTASSWSCPAPRPPPPSATPPRSARPPAVQCMLRLHAAIAHPWR